MKLKVTKASTFEINPAKKYVCIVTTDVERWSGEQKAQLVATLASNHIDVAFIPDGSKFKIVEQTNANAKA